MTICPDLSRSSVAVGVASDYVGLYIASDYIGPHPRFPAATPLLRRPHDPLWLSAPYRLQGRGEFILPASTRPSRHGRGPGDPPSFTARSKSELGPGPQKGRVALLPVCSQPGPQPFHGSRAASAAALPTCLRGAGTR